MANDRQLYVKLVSGEEMNINFDSETISGDTVYMSITDSDAKKEYVIYRDKIVYFISSKL